MPSSSRGVQPLITTNDLAERAQGTGLRIVDVRWYLDPSKSGRRAFEAGRIPGAVFMDAETDLSAPGGRRGGPYGRHPWPGAEQVARVIGQAGIDDRVDVVAYDDQAGAVAARLWFVLRAYGHSRVAVLDGGIPKWLAEGRPLETGSPSAPPEPRRFTPRSLPGWIVTKEQLVAGQAGGPVLDARVPERYRGDVEPIDPRPGHIPGARSAPFTDNLTPGSLPTFLPRERLREHYQRLGAEASDPIVYCGSGITACHDLLALDLAGIQGRLYAGSWSEWSADPSLPAERSWPPSAVHDATPKNPR
jgi:thiosulfate/3-mercaptopyruvate sulfurtransferase